MQMGSSFIGPYSGRQMFSPIGLLLDWMERSASSLSPLGALEQLSDETEGSLPVDHTPMIKWVRAYKIVNSFTLKYPETTYLFRMSQGPFIVISLTTLTHENIISTESIYKRKIFCLRTPLLTLLTTKENLVHLYSQVLAT